MQRDKVAEQLLRAQFSCNFDENGVAYPFIRDGQVANLVGAFQELLPLFITDRAL